MAEARLKCGIVSSRATSIILAGVFLPICAVPIGSSSLLFAIIGAVSQAKENPDVSDWMLTGYASSYAVPHFGTWLQSYIISARKDNHHGSLF